MKNCTVITPCFNPGKYLLPMLESVAAQGERVAKHIVMDGGSTDGTVEQLKAWAEGHPNFEFVSEPDKGQSDACRKAIEKVETEYFYWLNADDVLLDGAVEKLLSAIQDGSRPGIVYGDYVKIDSEGNVIARRKQPSFNYWDCLHGYLTVQNVASIFNASLLREVGGFDPSLRFVMDMDIILKLARKHEVRHVRSYCGAFRIHAASKTMTIDDVRQREQAELRTRFGVARNMKVRKILKWIAQVRVLCRMMLEGCLWDRIIERLRGLGS